MGLARIVAAVTAFAVLGIHAAAAQLLCSQFDGHGRCLVCVWSFYEFTLRPGEPLQPFVCGNMARDPRVTFKFGGTATPLGPDPTARVGLRISGVGYSYSRTWRGNTEAVPVGPAALPFGSTVDGATVAPTLRVTACGGGACRFVLSGKICLTGLC
jgi:hypothetical protein